MSLLLLVLCGCPWDISGTEDPVDEGEPDIEVDPLGVDFGVLDAGTVQTALLAASNLGGADLHLLDVSLEDPTAPFVIGPIGSAVLPPLQRTVFTITYVPESRSVDSARLRIDSDDPFEPTVSVALVGEAIAPELEVRPGDHDFGTLPVGCEASLPITLSNTGTADLRIDAVSYDTDSSDLFFDADEALYGELPWTLPPGASVQVGVEYVPRDEVQDFGELTVASSDPVSPEVVARHSGSGEVQGLASDVFEQPLVVQADVLFAVDRTTYVNGAKELVPSRLAGFLAELSRQGADYHVAAVTTDNGCVYSGGPTFIDDGYGEEEQLAILTEMVELGGFGSHAESLFTVLEAALENDGDGDAGCNKGFFRDEAALHLVAVSDEPEQSDDGYRHFVRLFQRLKDDPADVVLHAISGDYPTGCVAPHDGADFGSGYWEATLATGGAFLSICTLDAEPHMETLARATARSLHTFHLGQTPVPETLSVEVDGMPVTEGWSFNATDDSVEFGSDAIPAGGVMVEVSYVVLGECPG